MSSPDTTEGLKIALEYIEEISSPEFQDILSGKIDAFAEKTNSPPDDSDTEYSAEETEEDSQRRLLRETEKAEEQLRPLRELHL